MATLDEIGPGDLVRISREVEVKDVCRYSFLSVDGFRYYPKNVENKPETATIKYDIELIEKADPQHWPPQPGDLWEANNTEYFMRSRWNHALKREEVHAFDCTDRGVYSMYGNMESFKELKPTLKYRKANG